MQKAPAKSFGMIVAGLVLLMLWASPVPAATISVSPTGLFPDDRDSIQSAFNVAFPGDVIELGAGTFNWTGLVSGDIGVVISNANVKITGHGNAVIEGPGLFDTPSALLAFFVTRSSDGLTFEGITFRAFEFLLFFQPGADYFSMFDCDLERNQFGIHASRGGEGYRIIGNRASSPLFSEVSATWPVLFRGTHRDFTITDNVFTGPGINEDIVGTLAFASAGITVRHRIGQPAKKPERGLIARNDVRDFDLCIHSASDSSIIEKNQVTGCDAGIVVGTGQDEVISRDIRVVSNQTESNRTYGIVLIAAQDSEILHNDCRFNGFEGIGLAEEVFGNPVFESINNRRIHNSCDDDEDNGSSDDDREAD